jgi:hypothetical protein
MSATGDGLTRVTPDGVEASHPTWSPDGAKLAFVGFPAGGGSRDIYTIGVDGSGLAQVTTDPWSDLSPSWNPTTPTSPVDGQADRVTVTREVTLQGAHRTSAASTNAKASPPRHHKKKKHKPPPYTRRTTKIAPGLTLTRIVDRRIPQRIFMLKAAVQTTALTMDVALADNQLPGFETVRSMAGRHHAVAAVNGDFGLSTGRPMNIFAEDGDLKQTMYGWGNNFAVSDDEAKEFLGHPVQKVSATIASTGETWDIERFNEGIRPVFGGVTAYSDAGGSLMKPPDNACEARLVPDGGRRYDDTEHAVLRDYTVGQAGCFAKALPRNGGIVLAGNPADDEALMIRALQPGQTITLSWSLGWHRVLDSIGGFPMLLRDGRIIAEPCSSGFCGRNPRTGVGYTADGSVMLVVVDGRRSKYSIGMTLTGFAKEMRTLGAVTAMNLDGGGSTTMVVRGRVINNPSDPGGPRHVSSALLVLNGPDGGEVGIPRQATQGWKGSAWRLAAQDPGSTGGLVDALVSGSLWSPLRGLELDPALARILRLYRS